MTVTTAKGMSVSGIEATGTALALDRRPVFGKRVRRVPDEAFVTIGARLLPPPAPVARLPAPTVPVSANDNAAWPASVGRIVRDLLFLAILVVTLVGAFYSGRLHAFQRVIVVPGPATPGAVIT